jgi:hypothetical protein
MATKVVIVKTNLRGSGDERFPQRVASVYDGGDEFNVMAPWDATGDALEWLRQLEVYQLTPHRKNLVTDGRCSSIIQRVADELERRKLDADI